MIINLSCGSFTGIACNRENYYWSFKAHSHGAIATAIFLLLAVHMMRFQQHHQPLRCLLVVRSKSQMQLSRVNRPLLTSDARLSSFKFSPTSHAIQALS